MKIGILVAMDKEMELLKDFISDNYNEHGKAFDYLTGKVSNNDVVVQQCGIGKVNSALGAAEMISLYAPDIVISSGVAGSLNESVHTGETVIGTLYAYHDVFCGNELAKGQVQGMPSVFSAEESGANKDGNLLERIAHIVGANKLLGSIVSGDKFITQTSEKNSIIKDFPLALAVDMESCSIAQTCHIYKTPFVSIRIISDGCDGEEYEDFWANVGKWAFNTTKRILENL